MADIQVRDKLYIDGAWVPSTGSDTIEVINSATEEVMGRVPEATPADVDAAVAAAKRAFETWSTTSAEERSKYLQRIAEGLQARTMDIANVVAQELGMPINLSMIIQAGLPTVTFSSMPQLIDEIPWEETVGNSLVVKEPIGVVGAITPWNYPLHQIANKVAPALAAGCTVVLKPSEVTPLNAFILAEIIDDVGLPAGVFNLVSGTGPVVGEAIAAHPDIEKGVDEGAKLLTGGAEAPDGLDKGYFVKPTVFSEVRNDMTIAQEEIFGPVLSIIPYEGEDEAVQIANDTIYGLAAGVWSGDPERAKAVARRIRSGQVEVNGGAFNPMAPFGGFKQSGHGCELGKFAIDEFLTTKSLQL